MWAPLLYLPHFYRLLHLPSACQLILFALWSGDSESYKHCYLHYRLENRVTPKKPNNSVGWQVGSHARVQISNLSDLGIPCYLGFPGGTSGKEPACQCRKRKRPGFDPWVGRSPGGGHGNPLQYFCLENLMDRGTWWVVCLVGCLLGYLFLSLLPPYVQLVPEGVHIIMLFKVNLIQDTHWDSW